MTRDLTRNPLSAHGSIVTRMSGASARSDVIWQITTEAWLYGMAFVWTITAGRGFP
jgi:hypothetical protein